MSSQSDERPESEHRDGPRGRNTLWRYIAVFVLGPAIAFALATIVAIGLSFAGVLDAGFETALLSTARPELFFVLNGGLFLLLLVGFAWAIRWLHRRRFSEVIGRWAWREYMAGFALWTGFLVLAGAIDYLLAPDGFRIIAAPAFLQLLPIAVVVLAIQTFAEEFVFRGYLTTGLLSGLKRPVPAALLSGAVFGAMHIPNGAPQAVSATLFGALLSWIAIQRGGIAFPSGLHLANNLFAAMILVSDNDAFKGAPGLVAQDTPHLMWWDAAFGVFGLAVVAAAITFPRIRTLKARGDG